jgi:hypothetical protein
MVAFVVAPPPFGSVTLRSLMDGGPNVAFASLGECVSFDGQFEHPSGIEPPVGVLVVIDVDAVYARWNLVELDQEVPLSRGNPLLPRPLPIGRVEIQLYRALGRSDVL